MKHLLFSLLLTGLFASSSVAQTTSPPPSNLSTSKTITLTLSNASVFETLTRLNKEYGLNVMVDAFAPGQTYPIFFTWKDITPRQAIRELAQFMRRDVYEVGGVFVLRHHQWAGAAAQADDPIIRTQYPWKSEGTVRVSAMDDPNEEANQLDQRPERRLPDWAKTPSKLPRHHMSVLVNQAPAGEVVSAVANETLWNVRISSEVKRRRLTAVMTNVSPGVFFECLSLLLNAGPDISLTPSQAQKDLFKEVADDRLAWDKAADLLRPELTKLLTDTEKEALKRNERVEISVDRMPKELQDRVMNYVKFTAELIIKDSQQLDMTRWREFKIAFKGTSGGKFGVVAPSVGGVLLYY
jgi:hypothetical protein